MDFQSNKINFQRHKIDPRGQKLTPRTEHLLQEAQTKVATLGFLHKMTKNTVLSSSR